MNLSQNNFLNHVPTVGMLEVGMTEKQVSKELNMRTASSSGSGSAQGIEISFKHWPESGQPLTVSIVIKIVIPKS